MKMIMALIRNDKRGAVQEALLNAGLTGFTMSSTMGLGEMTGMAEPSGRAGMVPHIRVEVGVPDNWVDYTVDILRNASSTGQAGDGLIFVYTLDRAVKIRSGEEGERVLNLKP